MKCRICGLPAEESYLLEVHGTADRVQAFYCGNCSAYFTDPAPVSYDDWDGAPYYLAHAAYIEARHDKLFRLVEAVTGSKGRFLDIGSGLGLSLKVARARGWEACGIEPNKSLAAFGRDKLGLDVVHGYFRSDGDPLGGIRQKRFEYILIDNVLEHVTNPVEFLQDAEALLGASGILVVAVPPVDWLRSLFARLSYVRNRIGYASVNPFFDPVQHVNYFSRQALDNLARLHLSARPLSLHFHHHWLLNNRVAMVAGIFGGYYFLGKK
jgi:SAM-dependent methyltransferase